MLQYEDGIYFKCMLAGHDIRVTDFGEKIPGTTVRKLTCRVCKKHFVRDPMGKFNPWTPQMDAAMETFKNLQPLQENEE